MKMNCRSEAPQMNEETNYRRFWRNLVICGVLCLLLFWIPSVIATLRILKMIFGG
nr:MAG TPA: hypothetical protein [Caudoviricetes sp.]